MTKPACLNICSFLHVPVEEGDDVRRKAHQVLRRGATLGGSVTRIHAVDRIKVHFRLEMVLGFADGCAGDGGNLELSEPGYFPDQRDVYLEIVLVEQRRVRRFSVERDELRHGQFMVVVGWPFDPIYREGRRESRSIPAPEPHGMSFG